MTFARYVLCAALILPAGLAPGAARTPPPYAANHPITTPEIFAPGVISTGDDEAHPTFTAEGDTLYFVKNSPGFNHWTIVVSHFTQDHWSRPEVASFSGRYNDADVALSADERKLYFVSNRPVNGEPKQDTDLWVMQRTDQGWSTPMHLDTLASPGFEWFPSLTRDGTIYFGSERRQGNYGPKGTSDLWRAEWVNGHFTEPENLGPVINTAGNDIEAYVAPNESFIVFSSNGRADTRGSYDLYISYRRDGHWTEPQNLGDEINTASWEFGARLSPDGEYLFFTSNRGVFDKPLERHLNYQQLINKLRSPGNGLRDIYRVDAEVLPPPPTR